MPVKPVSKTTMPSGPARERAKSFEEVNHGYTAAMAVFEAQRCLRCQEPVCEQGCPVRVPIRNLMAAIASGRFDDAYRLLKEANPLPAVCGRVCPQEKQCEKLCHLATRFQPVAIGHVERFAADWERGRRGAQSDHPRKGREGKGPEGPKIAIVGSGPAGLVAAGDLVRRGYRVTVFEALHAPGGVLRYGIPEFRLPKDILDDEIQTLRDAGVEIVCNVIVGATVTLDQLMKDQGYDAVFIGTGAGLPKFLGIPGENLNGVYSANEFLTRMNLMKAYRFPEYDTPVKVGERVIVVGAGNTAMDAARSALRLGAKDVKIVYRRSDAEMTARVEEYHHAQEEGVVFHWLNNPVRIEGDDQGWVKQMVCQGMELGEPDASGRRRPVPVPGRWTTFPVDTVVMAIGNSPNPILVKATSGLHTTSWGGLIVNQETGETSRSAVYAGGDAVTGAATVILAAGSGLRAAEAIHTMLSSQKKGAMTARKGSKGSGGGPELSRALKRRGGKNHGS